MEIDLVEIQSSENYYELRLWPWGGAAILLAVTAILSSGSLLIVLLRQAGTKSATAYAVYEDEDDDDSLSSCSTSSDDDAVVEGEEEEDRACGSCDLIEFEGGNEMKSEDRDRLLWPEGIGGGGGGGVVRAWDGLGLGFRTSRSSVPFIALLDPSRDEVVRWFPVPARTGETSAVSMVPRDVILSGSRSEMDGSLAVSLWDARVAGDVPAAAGMRRRRRAAGEEWETVADWRRVGSPAATWWDDDDAVVVGGEGLEESWGRSGRGLVASWCRNAVGAFRIYPR